MSDAKQSVERCKYRHDWREGNGPEISGGHSRFYCHECGLEPEEDSKLWREASAIVYLRKLLKPGDTVYTVLKHVSRSGMSRNIDLYVVSEERRIVWIGAQVGHAIGSPQSEMDMGFHVVYTLSRVLFPEGSSEAIQTHNGDGGYALKHQWL